jgi:hypothetical protein
MQRRHAGPGFSMTSRPPVPPHRWHVHSWLSGWITTSSGGTARLLRQTLALAPGQLGRYPMGSVEPFDRRVAASTEPQPLSLRRARHIVRLARQQLLGGSPGPEQLHGFRDARQVGLGRCLEVFDLPAPPAIDRPGVEPSDPDQHVDVADVILGRECSLRCPDDPICELFTIPSVHRRSIASRAETTLASARTAAASDDLVTESDSGEPKRSANAIRNAVGSRRRGR